MSEVLISRRQGTGGGYASITVNYPAGSVCTCTKGSISLRAEDTSGNCAFIVPEAGTWTVTSTNGLQTKSQNVYINREQQGVFIILTYTLILFENGNLHSSSGGIKYANGQGRVDSNKYIYTYASQQSAGAFSTINSIDVSSYQNLYFRAKSSPVFSGYNDILCGISSDSSIPSPGSSWSSTNLFIACTSIPKTANNFTDYIIPINSVSAGYIKLGGMHNAWVSRIWLE